MYVSVYFGVCISVSKMSAEEEDRDEEADEEAEDRSGFEAAAAQIAPNSSRRHEARGAKQQPQK